MERQYLSTENLVEIARLSPPERWKAQESILVLASHTLWRSLLWPYPSASPTDHLQPRQLFDDLICCFSKFDSYPDRAFFYPSCRPSWLNPGFLIKVKAHCIAGELACFVLHLPDERHAALASRAENILPLGLLASLLRSLVHLRVVARTADAFVAGQMFGTATELATRHPLYRHVCFDPDVFCPAVPTHLSHAEYRSLLLQSTQEILEIIAAISEGAPLTAQLENHYRFFEEPIGELVDITESLVALAAKSILCPFTGSTLYKHLLWANHQAYVLLRQGKPNPTSSLLEAVKGHFRQLAMQLPACFLDQLQVLQRRFSRLQGNGHASSEARLSDTSPQKAIWH